MRVRQLDTFSSIQRAAAILLVWSASSCVSDGGMAYSTSAASNAQRISAGLQRLGATTSRGDCYGQRIAKYLDPAMAAEAVAIVERAGSRSEMRKTVMAASRPVRRAFIGANMRCSLA